MIENFYKIIEILSVITLPLISVIWYYQRSEISSIKTEVKKIEKHTYSRLGNEEVEGIVENAILVLEKKISEKDSDHKLTQQDLKRDIREISAKVDEALKVFSGYRDVVHDKIGMLKSTLEYCKEIMKEADKLRK